MGDRSWTTAAVQERRQNFGVCLLARFKRYQSPADLDQAIAQFEAAARDSPPDSVIHAAATNSLGNAPADVAGAHPGPRRTRRPCRPGRRDGRPGRRAGPPGLPENHHDRPGAAPGAGDQVGPQLGTWATARQSFAEAAEALGYGLQAPDQLFRVQMTRLQKEAWLRYSQAIPVLAAYALARDGDVAGAVTALERGRGLLLSEALQRDHAELGRLTKLGRANLQGNDDGMSGRATRQTILTHNLCYIEHVSYYIGEPVDEAAAAIPGR